MPAGTELSNGRYKIERSVAAGGMGAVYRAIDVRFNRPCAVKEMLDSARQVLEMAKRGALASYDVGPVFEVFQKSGGAEALSDLQQAGGQW